jgi:hypothetical protein
LEPYNLAKSAARHDRNKARRLVHSAGVAAVLPPAAGSPKIAGPYGFATSGYRYLKQILLNIK